MQPFIPMHLASTLCSRLSLLASKPPFLLEIVGFTDFPTSQMALVFGRIVVNTISSSSSMKRKLSTRIRLLSTSSSSSSARVLTKSVNWLLEMSLLRSWYWYLSLLKVTDLKRER